MPADRLREIREYLCGDFYPLLTFSLAADVWAAQRYDAPSEATGWCWRSGATSRRFGIGRRRSGRSLRARPTKSALGTVAAYGACVATGRCAGGFAVRIDAQPGSPLYTYRVV